MDEIVEVKMEVSQSVVTPDSEVKQNNVNQSLLRDSTTDFSSILV